MDYNKAKESVYFVYSLSTSATFIDLTGARGSASKVTHSFSWQVDAGMGSMFAFPEGDINILTTWRLAPE